MRKVIALLALLAVATPAFALEKAQVPPNRAERREVKEVRAAAKEKVAVAKEVVKKEREDAKKELKSKLAKIKDAKKREAVERIDNSINDLNKQRTEHFTKALAQLSEVLDRVSERADRASVKGVDVAATKVAIIDAKTALAKANDAVKVQAEKVYRLLVTDEATLKQKVGEARQLLRNDLAALQDLVKGAQVSIRKAATTLAKTPRVKDEAPEVVSPVATSTNAQ